MNPYLPDINKFERTIFKKRTPLEYLLSFSLKTMQARHVGILYGTNKSMFKFLPPAKWDRGVMHKFNGKGLSGLKWKYFGRLIVGIKGLSPVMLYRDNQFGEKEDTGGVISFVLRKHKDFYSQGIKILVIDIKDSSETVVSEHEMTGASVLSYDGSNFQELPDLEINSAIVRQFEAKNFVSAYIPDYGAIVFNTINERLLEKENNAFRYEEELKKRLGILISSIEMASLAYIGSAKGRQAVRIIWRKEKSLRKAALELKQKAAELNEQKEYLKAVGAVNETQLNMEAVNVSDGAYAFMDMVGSATVRKEFSPRNYFYILNLCHQIAADNASRYSCRIDNFMGDCVFFVNVSPFDKPGKHPSLDIDERVMLMMFNLCSIFNDIEKLKKGKHRMDKERRVEKMISDAGISIDFRAGLEIGSAMIGPLGSRKRKIVTAIGKSVNNASRLESSGMKQKIHVSTRVLKVLNDAVVTPDYKIMWNALKQAGYFEKQNMPDEVKFLESYKHIFRLGEKMMTEKSNVSYKEFIQDKTYLVDCMPEKPAL